jgi:MFS transporter, PAT family, beta-lactamase induction signal transducer AmpG
MGVERDARPPGAARGMSRYLNARILAIGLLGFSSGMPLALSGGTLQAWMAVAGVDIKTIGILTLAGLPYTWKFLWSPAMDRYAPALLGRRRGWILLTQAALAAAIASMGFVSPSAQPWTLASMALAVAFLSATQDIAFDAYRVDVLAEPERGLGAAASVLGYRIAMLTSGALALILADRIGWPRMYWMMAGLVVACMLVTLRAPEPVVRVDVPVSLYEAVWRPLRDFFARRGALAFLVLIVLYKLPDALAGALTTAFLIKGVGFTPTEVGAINKGVGLLSTMLGVTFGGALMVRLGLTRSLLAFGILQGSATLAFMWLAGAGKSYALMALAVVLENLTSGMGTAAFVALLMALCDARYSATQYALLSALAAFGRVYVGPSSGYLQAAVGWSGYFFAAFLSTLPGLAVLWWMRAAIDRLAAPAEGP